ALTLRGDGFGALRRLLGIANDHGVPPVIFSVAMQGYAQEVCQSMISDLKTCSSFSVKRLKSLYLFAFWKTRIFWIERSVFAGNG
ncbi:hypothetical protein, partial [Pandoraea pnomenusa]|uniref:hypothetical protein n=1 Tax=Pandoraea pnomenusa TaxID=93220 RepID=UPI00138E53AB